MLAELRTQKATHVSWSKPVGQTGQQSPVAVVNRRYHRRAEHLGLTNLAEAGCTQSETTLSKKRSPTQHVLHPRPPQNYKMSQSM